MNKVQEPLVSICCITYNHEKYIRDAIEGFLMQKTDFPFEIIIHDDASTDMTANIIKEYEMKYSKLIIPIYQVENQYSKGISPLTIVFKQSKGKYIAICEGDDYWIDPLKLQKQIMEMEKHPECYISFHPAIVKWEDGNRKDKLMCNHSNKCKIFKIEKVILGDGGFMPTNSIIIHRKVIPNIISFFEMATNAPIGDYYIQILSSENGGALFIDNILSVYRRGISSSWSSFLSSDNSFLNSFIATNDNMNEFTRKKYSKQFAKRNKQSISERLKSINTDINVRKNIFQSYHEQLTFTDIILWHALFKHPITINIMRKIQSIHQHI